MINHLPVEVHSSQTLAPRYPASTVQLSITRAVITEKGTINGLPIVDFQMVDQDGNEYFACLTGRIVNSVSAVVKGCNVRNHGQEEP